MKSRERASPRSNARLAVMGIGGLYILIALVMVLVPTTNDGSSASWVVIFAFVGGSGLVLLIGGYRLTATDIDPKFDRVVLTRTLVGIAVMLGILGLYHAQPDTGLTEPQRSLPILSGFSGVAGLAVGLSDARALTREERLERQKQVLQDTQKRLEASNERLEQFAYAASHDLQEPLRMISSYLRLLEDRYGDEFDDDGETFLEYAIDGSDRLSAMIEGLLDYSRVETEGQSLETVALETVLEDVHKDLALRLAETGATLEVGPLPSVKADPRQIRQLFQNLVSNALEYSDEPPTIEITAERDGLEWILSVRDDGIGIDPADQNRIFEVFHRLHSHEEHAGTGIGLAMCKRIVERHGGNIWVDSEPGIGSTFFVSLPVAGESAAAQPSRIE